jgi:hypothetical protein
MSALRRDIYHQIADPEAMRWLPGGCGGGQAEKGE